MVQHERLGAGSRYSHREILAILSGVLLGIFLAVLEQTIVGTALPTIASELGSMELLSWVVSAYLLTATVATPIYGKLSDLYGRRALLRVAIAIFVTGSIGCALAQSMLGLVVARAVQGFGGGGLIVLGQATLADVIAPRERARYQAYTSGTYLVASVAGPVLGGLFVDYLSWRWVFWINLPIGLVALALCQIALRWLKTEPTRGRVDFAGAALLTPALTGLLLIASWGGSELSWSSPSILGLAVASGLLMSAFAWQETRAAEPLLPPRLFGNAIFRVTVVSSFFGSMAMYGAVIFLPLFLQLVAGVSASNSGLLLAPMTGGIIGGVVLAAQLLARTGRYKIFPFAGLATASIAFCILAQSEIAGPAAVTALMALLGIGLGMALPIMLLAMQNAVEPRDIGSATAAVSSLRTLGGTFGVVFLNEVLLAGLDHSAGEGGSPVAFLLHSRDTLARMPETMRQAVVAPLASSFHVVFLIAGIFAALACIAAAFLREMPLRASASTGD